MKRVNLKLLTMLLALVVSVTAIVGGTVAFFVDEAAVTAAGQGENLDLELSYWDGSDWVAISNAEELLDAPVVITQADARYEPGYTKVMHLRLHNAGSMALKYKLNAEVNNTKTGTNIDDGDAYMLSDHLKAVAIPTTDDAVRNNTLKRENIIAYEDTTEYLTVGDYYDKYDTSPAENPTETLKDADGNAIANSFVVPLALGEENGEAVTEHVLYSEQDTSAPGAAVEYYTVALWMPTEVSNEANNLTSDDPAEPTKYQATIEIGLKASATQYTYESDFAGKDYDEEATLGSTAANGGNEGGNGGNGGGTVPTADPGSVGRVIRMGGFGVAYVLDAAGDAVDSNGAPIENDTGWAVTKVNRGEHREIGFNQESYNGYITESGQIMYKEYTEEPVTEVTGPVVQYGYDRDAAEGAEQDTAIAFPDAETVILGARNIVIKDYTFNSGVTVIVRADTTLYGTESMAFNHNLEMKYGEGAAVTFLLVDGDIDTYGETAFWKSIYGSDKLVYGANKSVEVYACTFNEADNSYTVGEQLVQMDS